MKTVHEGTFLFPATHPLFADHFEGAPVVPGSLLLRAFVEEAGTVWPDFATQGATGFRFRRFVTPGRHPFRMERTDLTVRCTLMDTQGGVLVRGDLTTADATGADGEAALHTSPRGTTA
ncbi:hydroxymyristoyl-ACP dehydratase [Nitratidesulfovibrio vulgaris]|uniref:Putative 3R-hydroxymyristoyl ACP dehydrase n=1 Tax=Nitratidesulfovibrio vulgaris (strain DP4) TaxID=391774 RepID=A0A0H3A5W7_NITV4|nr:hydroxymyristoyl-ACP dehydratase [Nitratidesulfovibrio vulgaris]ABM27711.1 putative 3R-hydroxymyristoyl ACP dehydrase [Nitratidesulfovibrio vulgaris DP4]GEB80992.1 hydroxymyristoyl-ACP dehydratase [Desulfovibrio desulfuricans]